MDNNADLLSDGSGVQKEPKSHWAEYGGSCGALFPEAAEEKFFSVLYFLEATTSLNVKHPLPSTLAFLEQTTVVTMDDNLFIRSVG